MKLCAFIQNGSPRVGVRTEKGIADITALGFPAYMNGLIAGGDEMLARVSDAVKSAEMFIDEDTVRFGNITNPAKIVCEGLNFTDHAAETGGEPPEYPVFFSKFNDALHPAGEPVTLPSWQRCFDYEAELVIVVGKYAYNVSEEDAPEYIFGYTCGNDLSARDSQFLSSQWLSGKSFPGFGPAGPYIVTRGELDPDEKSLAITCMVNGECVQSGCTGDMIYNCRQTLSWASKYFPLSPGDMIFTGTPAGVILGKPKDRRVWLKSGDIVTVEIEGIGKLVSPLV